MLICGVSFESKACVVTLIDFKEASDITHIHRETRRVTLDDHEEDFSLRGFQQTARAFLTDNSVNLVAIKKCVYSGKYQSGAPSLKMEALLQVLPVDSVLIPGQKVNREFNKHTIEIPDSVLVYQHDAFKTATVLGIEQVGE